MPTLKPDKVTDTKTGADVTPPKEEAKPVLEKKGIDPSLVEPKEKQGPYNFDPHIVVPGGKNEHFSGAIKVDSDPAIRVLPSKAEGLNQNAGK